MIHFNCTTQINIVSTKKHAELVYDHNTWNFQKEKNLGKEQNNERDFEFRHFVEYL